jgi:hypothetical protein
MGSLLLWNLREHCALVYIVRVRYGGDWGLFEVVLSWPKGGEISMKPNDLQERRNEFKAVPKGRRRLGSDSDHQL